MNARRAMRAIRCRPAVEAMVLLLVGIVVWRTWYLEGFPVFFEVASGSMAPALLGPHRDLVCGDCGFPLVCGCDFPTSDYRAVCPNCGFAGNDVRGSSASPGDRVLVHRSAFLLRQPRRWELVAFRSPDRAGELAVKRVVGLPGETVQIRDGDLYVDGALVRKTLDQQRATGILVHDARYEPHLSPAPLPRWRPEGSGSRWRRVGESFVHPGGGDPQAIDWLTYHHARRIPGRPGEVQEGPVMNEYSYNQGLRQPTESFRAVPDLRLEFRAAGVSGRGVLWVRATDGCEEFQVQFDLARRRYEILRGGRPLEASGDGPLPERSDALRVEVSLVDQQLLLAINGQPQVAYAYDRPKGRVQAASRPFAIGVQDIALTLSSLRIYRDVVYARAEGGGISRGEGHGVRLGGDEYLVLGDNAAISNDSRTWVSGPGVSEGLLFGKPFFVIFPARAVDLAGCQIRVPDLRAIRYIR